MPPAVMPVFKDPDYHLLWLFAVGVLLLLALIVVINWLQSRKSKHRRPP